jgi:hypothetical protein
MKRLSGGDSLLTGVIEFFFRVSVGGDCCCFGEIVEKTIAAKLNFFLA